MIFENISFDLHTCKEMPLYIVQMLLPIIQAELDSDFLNGINIKSSYWLLDLTSPEKLMTCTVLHYDLQ